VAIKRLFLTLIALASLTNAQATVDAFYSGVYLGMPYDDAIAYFLSGDPPIANRGSTAWGGAPKGQHLVDFRIGPDPNKPYDPTDKTPERRVQILYRESDRIIVSVGYYNIDGGHFENEDLKQLLDINRGRVPGHLVSHLYGKYGDEEFFEVTTVEQYKLEQAP
jgi:hypothetical protein